jgi:dTDP-glucose pyrophosphorylase
MTDADLLHKHIKELEKRLLKIKTKPVITVPIYDLHA